MSNAWDDIRAAISTAGELNPACDANATTMARIITPRLRTISSGTLAELKRALRDFNIQTGRWK